VSDELNLNLDLAGDN